MAISGKKYLKISKGQISSRLIERTDIGILDDSGQEITNFYNTKYGALQTVPGTTFVHNFGKDAKVKLHVIHLLDNKEAILAFDATNKTLTLFDYAGNQLDKTSFPYITEDNYEKSNIAQQEDLILLATGDNPLIQINITNNKLGFNVFAIEAKNILKVSNLTVSQSDNSLFEKKTPGDYSFTLTREEEITVRISGAGGGKFYGDVISSISLYAAADGEVYEYTFKANIGDVISGTVGSRGISSAPPNGGTGYNNGSDGTYVNEDNTHAGGGGGGSSSLFINGTLIYEASGGRGSNIGSVEVGGAGGGPLGNVVHTGSSDGANGYLYLRGTDGRVTENLAEDGFVKIFRTSIPVGTDINRPDSQFTNSAVAGIISISGLPISGTSKTTVLFDVATPNETLDVEKYARSIVIGTNFDSESALGVVRITDIEGYISDRLFRVTKIKGPTIIGFDKAYTASNPAKGFKITTSSVPAFSGDFPNTDNNPTAYKNYPNLITFYQQRLIIFGTQYNAEQVLLSNIGKYNNFVDDYLSTSAFQLVIGSDQKESIRAFCLNQGVQIFTNVSEWLMNGQTITRTTGFIRNSQMGTNGVKPIISANGTTLFCPRNGKGLIGFMFNEQSASYMTPYISLFTDLLDREISDICLKRGLDSQDDTLLFVCTKSGDLIIGNYLQDHNIQAFCLRHSDFTQFKQAVQAEENVIILSSRNGYTVLENIDETKRTAHSASYTYDNATGIISNIPEHYENQVLNVYSEKGFIGQFPVINGQIDLSEQSPIPQYITEIGFNIHQVFESNPMNLGAETMAYYKAISNIKLALTPESRHEYIKINKKYGRRKGDMISFVRPQKPMRDCRFTIENDIYPIEILSIEVEIEY